MHATKSRALVTILYTTLVEIVLSKSKYILIAVRIFDAEMSLVGYWRFHSVITQIYLELIVHVVSQDCKLLAIVSYDYIMIAPTELNGRI